MKRYLFKYFILFLITFVPLRSWSQASNPVGINLNKSFPSPEVASLGRFGLIPTNTYTGQANISIPLYEISYKDLSVPLTLSYSMSGNKPDDHPGWTGLGWTLRAGGVIYRKVNSLYDEHPKDPTYTNETAYLYNCGRVTQNYTNIDSINAYAFNGANISTAVNAYDAFPDEFIFNFNGYSGSFYFVRPTPTGALQIKIKSGGDYRLKAELLEIRDHITFDDFISGIVGNTFETRSSGRSIYKIRITDDKGVQYIFGGDANAIEFSNNGDFTYDYNTIPSAWYLTEIKSPSGYKISLNYKKVGRTFIQQIQRNVFAYNSSAEINGHLLIFNIKTRASDVSSGSSEAFFISANSPSYLSSITTPSQTVNFISSKSTELNYPFDVQTMTRLHSTANEESGNSDSSYWQKLDLIDIVGVKKIKFNYLNQPSRRLQLTSLESKTQFDRTIQQYTFSYNSLLLPPYNARKADHWGYYNGRSYAYDINYVTTRRPDAAFMNAEILEKITYPTGGYTQLQYEPHYYRKVARQFPFVVDTQTADSMAGGLRIKKIISTPDLNTAAVTKEYFYITNYLNGGTSSSGLLSGRPEYADSGSIRAAFNNNNSNFWSGSWSTASLYYGRVVDNNFLPLSNTNGNHITYSEVTEKTDGGYTVYKYSNHDNGYQDLAPARTVTNYTSAWHEEGFTSMEAFRGLLLLNQVYNGNKQLLKADSFEYNIDTSNVEYKVPYFCRLWDLQGIGAGMSRVSVCFFFTKPPLIKKTTEINYVSGSALSPLTITSSNKYFNEVNTTSLAKSYDNYKIAETMSNTSRQEVLRTVYNYPYSRVAAGKDPGGVYQSMIDSNANSVLAGQVEFRDGVQTRLTNTSFYQPYAGLFVPNYIQVQQGTDSIDTEMYFNSYDQLGNILQATKKGGEQGSYIWDYQGQYPVAAVKNAGQSDIAYTSFEGENKGNWAYIGDPVTDSTSPSGFKCYHLGSTSTLLLYLSKTGLTTDKSYVVSYWSKSGSYTVNGSVSVSTGRSLNGWTYYEHIVKNVTEASIKGTGNIDEVRLYPSDAQMTTYTYLPLNGMSSQCDTKNQFVYYEYDSFGRLHIVRNQDKNIVKMICYNYKGEVEICNEHIYYNTIQSDSGRSTCNPGASSKMVVYTVPARKYGSDVSQQAADAKARAEAYDSIHLGDYVGRNGGLCLFYNQRMTRTAAKQCSSGFTGTSVTYVVDSMTYFSPYSTQAANDTATADLNANYQAHANTNGTCQCLGESKKVINGTCATGQKIVTASTFNGSTYVCTYHYLWSDGSISGNYTQNQTAACPLTTNP